MRVVLLATLLLAPIIGTACGEKSDTRVRGNTLTVYMSVPRHGVSAAAGERALAGARRALTEAGATARGRRVRLVALSSTKAAESVWDPGTVERAAERAAKDPTAIAYIGEHDSGASAVSLPTTNAARLLQVSPSDGLTSLTRSPPGRPRAGPERLRPEGVRNFVRLVPSDLRVARALMRRARPAAGRGVAIVHTEGVAERELTALLARLADAQGTDPIVAQVVRDDPDRAETVVREIAVASPGVVVLAAAPGAGTSAVLWAIDARLPRVKVLCARAMLRLAANSSDPRCDLTVASPPDVAMHGYEAMRLVLEAIARGGPDREAVMAAGIAPRERRSVLGRYTVRRTGDVTGLALTFVAPPRGVRRGSRPVRVDPKSNAAR